jgi:N-acyl-D-amino-acid deacylase
MAMTRWIWILALLLSAALTAPAESYDLLVRGALVVDGTGRPAFPADIAVRNGQIVRIGPVPDTDGATRVIQADRRVVAPGFIDVHTHVEGAVERIPRGDNFLMDGVTTIVTGNCGSSVTEIAKWLADLEAKGLGLNLATLVGHNSVRAAVMGTSNREATPEEITRMQALVETGMLSGAVGFSTGLIYIPGTYSNSDEVVALARAAAKHGGVYASHMRDEGARILDAIHEAARVGQETGMKVQLSHFKIDTPRIWGFSTKSLALVEDYRSKGVQVFIDQYPYERSSTNLGITLPSWALADGNEAIRQRLTDPATRRRVATEMKEMLLGLGHKDYSYATVASFSPERSYEGKNIAEIAKMRGLPGTLDDQIETILDMMLKGRAQMVYHSMGEEDIERIMRWPLTAVASDGGVRDFGQGVPHPRSYGTNARVLAEYVRKRKVLTLEDAIRRMTALPASTFGFRDRGQLAEGFAADLVILDPARVQDKATYTAPHAFSEGFDYVFVNGVEMVSRGALTEARGGRVLRGPASGAP